LPAMPSTEISDCGHSCYCVKVQTNRRELVSSGDCVSMLTSSYLLDDAIGCVAYSLNIETTIIYYHDSKNEIV
jgi:hypothetical protein